MNEIGGYFGLDSLIGGDGEYYKDAVALNTARNALVYIIKSRHIKKIYIPYLLCDSVALVCQREGFSYELYHVDSDFMPIFGKMLDDDEYLYVVNLYGQISNENIIKLREQYVRIIVDNIHAFFQKPVEGIDTIYSCRKFFGVPDGAYLATDCLLNEELLFDNSEGRTSHIYGRIKDGASVHYTEFKANDDSFKQLPLMQMSGLTHEMLNVLDYEKIKTIREENYEFLHNQLGNINKLKLRMPEGPYAYPFYFENGLEIKRKLAEKKIYVATLWPNVLELEGSLEKEYAENILPLPCDQRYDYDDMRIVYQELVGITEN